ncbi:MAG TPA: DinB family protein [Terriglobia bacterium]|nr:DinB family protein [Terriglobia bacterium]
MAETAEQYRNRMYSYLEGRDPLVLLAVAPQKLEGLIEGVSAAKLRQRSAPGKWSICEIVAHLADTELVGGYRIRMILGAPGATIQAFDQDDWAAAMQYQKRNVRKSLDQYHALRQANLALLKSLTPKQWKQYGMHSERGEESVETIVRMFAGHDINHREQVKRILSAKK